VFSSQIPQQHDNIKSFTDNDCGLSAENGTNIEKTLENDSILLFINLGIVL